MQCRTCVGERRTVQKKTGNGWRYTEFPTQQLPIQCTSKSSEMSSTANDGHNTDLTLITRAPSRPERIAPLLLSAHPDSHKSPWVVQDTPLTSRHLRAEISSPERDGRTPVRRGGASHPTNRCAVDGTLGTATSRFGRPPSRLGFLQPATLRSPNRARFPDLRHLLLSWADHQATTTAFGKPWRLFHHLVCVPNQSVLNAPRNLRPKMQVDSFRTVGFPAIPSRCGHGIEPKPMGP